MVEAYWRDVEAQLSQPVDHVYLCHHSAMVATHLSEPDGELAARIRGKVDPDAPIVQTPELHGNILDQMRDLVDLICGYRTNPHVDMINVARKLHSRCAAFWQAWPHHRWCM